MIHRPLPSSQLHYADPALNDEAQTLPIQPFVDRVHFPTLGCPALLGPGNPLKVVVSLPEGEPPGAVSLTLVDRHGGTGDVSLPVTGEPVSLGVGPLGKAGKRVLWQLVADVSAAAPRLYDLAVRTAAGPETQANAVRVYAEITGKEKVVFCGDPQYHLENAHCLERFVERMNARDDIAWIALIGDVCDNAVRDEMNLLRLAWGAKPGPVHSYYEGDFPAAARRLAKLNKPILLMVGNHDGMVAYDDYAEGEPTTAYLGPDPKNKVAYDGLHHFRRTFGPLYFSVDWANTRYLCTNTFELDRHQRMGYHAIVANWGGWMRAEQTAWLGEELSDADARGMHKVVFMHHDPRGGSEGHNLGYYKDYRPYTYSSTADIAVAYLRYVGHVFFTRERWQQEWMKWPAQPLDEHPVRGVLSSLLEHRVWAVVMGHDNENWVETYSEGDGVFSVKPVRADYPLKPASADEAGAQVDAGTVQDVCDLLEERQVGEVVKLLEGRPPEEAQAVIQKAIARLDAQGAFKPKVAFAPADVKAWGLEAKATIHFTHVDDVGAYKHSKESDFDAYGYVVAQLEEGRPVSIQRFDLHHEKAGPRVDLAPE